MKSFEELHIHHGEVSSEVQFLKKEVEFLLKILRNCYSTSVKLEKIKLLDAYWKGFEQNIEKLNSLSEKIMHEEQGMAVLCQDGLIDFERTLFNEDNHLAKLRTIEKEVKLLKESFYEFMQGCNACALKS